MLRDNIQKFKIRPRAGDMYDASRRYNPILRRKEVPLLVEGRPEIVACAISQYFPVWINQICEDRSKYIARKYPGRSIAVRKLAEGRA